MACGRGKLFCVTYYNDEGYYFYLFYKTLFSLILDALPNIQGMNKYLVNGSKMFHVIECDTGYNVTTADGQFDSYKSA